MTKQRFIDEIKIAGFKSIRELTFPLGRLNVLIGANGAGKSNFIGVFSLLNAIFTSRLQSYTAERGGASSLLHYGRKVTTEIKIALTFGDNALPASPRAIADFNGFDSHNYMCALKPDDNDTFFFELEECNVWKSSLIEGCTAGAGRRETMFSEWAKANSTDLAKDVWKSLWGMKVFHFHDTSESSPMKQSSPLTINSLGLHANAGNIASLLYFLKEHNENSYREIVRTIQMVAPFFADFSFGNVTASTRSIRLEWRDTKSDAYFNANMLSDGTSRFICLATLLLQPDPPAVIILDEPELGLHPAAISLLAEMIKSASQKSQIIISTQSVTLINHFSPEDIIVAERKQETGESIFTRLNKEAIAHWLEDYALGAIWEKNIIGGRP